MSTSKLVLAASAGLIALGILGMVASTHGAEDKPAASSFDPRDEVAVRQLRERALGVLSEAQSSPRPEVRANAIEALLLAPKRLETALPLAMKDASAGVRAVACGVIGKGQLKAHAELARPLVEEPNDFVRMGAIYALARCRQSVDQSPLAWYLLKGVTPKVRAQAAYILGELGNESALPLLREAGGSPLGRNDPGEDRLMRLQIAEAMVKLGDDKAIEEIQAALYPSRAQDLEASALACQIMGQLRHRSSAKMLMEITGRTDEKSNRMPAEVRLAAGTSLGQLGYPSAHLGDEFIQSPESALRAQAAAVLGATRDRAQLGKLQGLLDDADIGVRVAASAAVLRLVDPEAASR